MVGFKQIFVSQSGPRCVVSGVESWVLRATGIRPRTTCWPASTINTPTTHISHTGLLESGRICGGWSACRTMSKHRENSPVTQTTTQPTLLTWGGGPWKKKFPPTLAMLPNPVLLHLSGHSDPIVLKPFDVTLWYSCVPPTPNLLKISLDTKSDFRNGFFSTLHTYLKIEPNFYDHY